MFRVLLITDRTRARRPLPAVVDEALSRVPSGRVAIQLREKDLPARPLAELARALLEVCGRRGAPLLINDRVDLALALGLSGVHLPASGLPPTVARQLLGPSALVGVSCHSLAEVVAARDTGASYVTLGPIFDTRSKRGFGAPLGPEVLMPAAALGIPVLALGGIGLHNAAHLPGAGGLAAIAAWLDSDAPASAVAQLLELRRPRETTPS